jgi:hypothetical protein
MNHSCSHRIPQRVLGDDWICRPAVLSLYHFKRLGSRLPYYYYATAEKEEVVAEQSRLVFFPRTQPSAEHVSITVCIYEGSGGWGVKNKFKLIMIRKGLSFLVCG